MFRHNIYRSIDLLNSHNFQKFKIIIYQISKYIKKIISDIKKYNYKAKHELGDILICGNGDAQSFSCLKSPKK